MGDDDSDQSSSSCDEGGDKGGLRDDAIQKVICTSTQTMLGTDLVLVCQYNDCIIFDCITNYSVQSIQVPALDN
jgi:hypothetical protein